MSKTAPKRPAPPPPINNPELLQTFFDRVDTNKNGKISATELQSALTNGLEEFPFSLSTVKSILDAFKYQEEINFEQFGNIWRYINDWQKCFKRFDVDKSGSINSEELYTALVSFGYFVSKSVAQLLVKQFDKIGKNEILFDDFIKSCLVLFGLTREFQIKDEQQIGKVEITYEEYLVG